VIAGLPGLHLHRLVALLCLLVAALCMAAPHAAEAPRDASGLVAVPPLARVTDLAGALKPADVQALETKLAAHEIAKGSQIAIVVLPTTQPEPIADFAQRVGDAWKIGRKGVGDGVLITVAVEDRRVWISVARALEGALPDVAATRISRELIAPRFREGDYGGGLVAGLDAILQRLDGEALPPPVRSAAGPVSVGGDVMPILIGVVLAGIGVGSALRRMLGVPGALVAAGGSGVVTGALLASALLGGLAGLVVLVGSVMGASSGGGGGRVLGGRRRGGAPIFIPGGWSGGGRGGGIGGGWGGGGGWSSGGGGDFAGGGGGSSW